MLPFSSEDEPMRRLTVDRYLAPAARVEDGRVVYVPATDWRWIRPTVRMFEDFVNLSVDNGSDKDVRAFVRRWGPLLVNGETVAEHRRRAQAARAILNISENLEAGEVGNPKDWEVLAHQEWLNQYLPPVLKAAWRSTVQPESGKQAKGSLKPWPQGYRRRRQRELIAAYINAWLILGEVRPALTWTSIQPALSLAIAGPFGAMAVQLLETAGRCVVVTCSGCRRFFDVSERLRKPKFGQGRYCSVCIEAGVPVTLAKRRKFLGQSKSQQPKGKQEKRADKR